MKKLTKIACIIVIITAIGGCKPKVYFNNPQPDNAKNIQQIPKHLQGNYLGVKDSTRLTINKNVICKIYRYTEMISENELDSTYVLGTDSLFSIKNKEKWAIRYVGDSIKVYGEYLDTIFYINDVNLLRKLKGTYFLNTQYGTNKWEVKTVRLHKKRLIIGSITSDNEVKVLKEITKSEQDSNVSFQLSKEQLKMFLRQNGFADKEEYIKQ